MPSKKQLPKKTTIINDELNKFSLLIANTVRCNICGDFFNSDEKTPLIFPDGSTYCRACANEYDITWGRLENPLNSTQKKLDLSNIPVNYRILSLANGYHNVIKNTNSPMILPILIGKTADAFKETFQENSEDRNPYAVESTISKTLTVRPLNPKKEELSFHLKRMSGLEKFGFFYKIAGYKFIISDVDADSIAYQAGLRVNDCIKEVLN